MNPLTRAVVLNGGAAAQREKQLRRTVGTPNSIENKRLKAMNTRKRPFPTPAPNSALMNPHTQRPKA
jgi:hypothetical protein